MIILKEKNEIINQYEIGLSKMLINKGYSPAVYVQYDVNTKDNILQLALRVIHKPFKILKLFFKPVYYFSIVMSNKGNASIAFWEKLIRYHRMPFVKKSLFINKKEGKDYKEKLKILEEINTDINYPLSLIERYIEMYRDGK
jgi:lipopolysaccharide biosynthesis protein